MNLTTTDERSRERVRELLAELDDRLREPGMIDEHLFTAFVDHQRTVGLVHGVRPLLQHLHPHLIDEHTYQRIAESAELVGSALNRVANFSVEDGALARKLGLSAVEQTLAALDPGYPELLVVGRLDTLMDEQGNHFFIELNADSPAGIADQLLIQRCLRLLPHLAGLGTRSDIRAPEPHAALLAALRETYAAFGGTRRLPTIAIVDWARVDTRPELLILAELWREAGHPTLVVDPDDLSYDGFRLSAGNRTIDLVYRRVIQNELIAHGGLGHPLVRAYRDRAVCVANSFRTKALNKKSAFAILSDPLYAELFTQEEQRAIRAHVPWTRVIERRPTYFHGERVDLIELISKQREDFVIKPNDEYGGKGVLLGWETSEQVWTEAVESAETNLMIVQERKRGRTLPLPTFRQGAVVVEDVYSDLCPFLFAGKMGGLMARVSTSAVTNVSAGGGVSGLLVVSDGDSARA